MANLEQRLLTGFTTVVSVVIALVIARDLLSGGDRGLLSRGVVLVVLVALAVLVTRRRRWRLGELRAVEAAVFVTLTLFLAWTSAAVGVEDPDAAAAAWTSTLIGFGLLMIAYGVFALNPLRRAAVGVAAIGAASVASAFVVRAGDPALRAALDAALSGRLFETGLILGACGVVALVASFVIFTLYNYAFDQRKRTFYDLEERIGSGGMGEVWRGRHQTLARPTAIKLIREDRIAGADAEAGRRVLQRFEREAKATASLRSPHTIEVYDFGVTGDGHFYYAMEFLVGLDLQALVEQFGPLPAERVVHLLLQACDSLADAHNHAMTHRDVKPANMFLSRLGPSADHLKLLDFGLVQQVQPVAASGKLTAEGTVTGTPAYMAPEMVVGRNPVDRRADIYALGCVAYWLLTGTQVFETESGVEQVVEHVKTSPTPPSERTDFPIPAELEAIVLRCLEKQPADRIHSATALAQALRDVPLAQPWDTGRAEIWWAAWTPPAVAAELTPASERITSDRPMVQG